MPTYAYSADRGRSRSLEKVVWVIMLAMVGFLLLSTFHPAVKAHITKNPGSFTMGLVIIYLMFLIFSRRVFKQQRLSNVRIATTRRNFTFNDVSGEKIHSWRDVKEAAMRVEVDRTGQAYVQRLQLEVPKGRVTLDNDPLAPLTDMAGLLHEVRERVGRVLWRFHWYHPVCPLCKGALDTSAGVCTACGERVVYVSKMLRPWQMFREESLYVFLLLVVAAPTLPALYPLALAFVVGIVGVALLANTPRRLRPLVTGEPPDEAPGGGGKGASAAVAFALATLLLASGVAQAAPSPSAAPAASWPWRAWTGEGPAPRKPDSTYFPLAEGNLWEYRSNFETVRLKVNRRETVNGAQCWVVESTVGDNPEVVQSEYFAVGTAGIDVYKRSHKGSEFFLDPPEPMLAFPLREGRHWTWQGNSGQGNVMLAFEVKGERRIPVVALGQEVTAMLVLIHGRAADGSEIQTKRWYSRGIGMVREQSILKKAGKSTTMDATLQNYSLVIGPRSRE